jgi:polyhydroxybutyrate depolymerase
MAYRLACERPDLVAAVATVAGGMSASVASQCPGDATVSVIGMHGTADPLVPLDSAIRNDLATWVRRDRCPSTPRSSPLPDLAPDDGTTTRVDTYGPCADGAAVTFYEIAGGGHAWPGGTSKIGRGAVSRDFDAAEVIWDFFQKHARR